MKTESIQNPIVYFTDKKTDVFTFYYDYELDTFGNEDDWINKDGYDMLVFDAALPAQEIDVLFNNHYNKA